MKDVAENELKGMRPELTAAFCVDVCLDRLFRDDKHFTKEEVVDRLTFEELIGSLLAAKDDLEELECRRMEEKDD